MKSILQSLSRHFMFPVAMALTGILIFRLLVIVVHPNISEPNITTFLFFQWFVYGALLIFTSLYLLSFTLDKILPWKRYAGSRFLIQLILGTALSLTCINIVYSFLKQESTSAPGDLSQVILLNIYGAAFILPIFSSYFGYKFLKAWRKSEVESERLLRENTRSQLLSLRNHLDPHFLFNNLNILSSLMDNDIELSKTYLNKFAEVYRVILKTEYSDLTMLEDELKLIESYVYLIKIRFKDCVYFNFNISTSLMDKALPPLTIQMLIENAIKHNLATTEKPITLELYDEDGMLIVQNNLQKKKYLPRERKATGIENIRKRYEFFTDKNIDVVETDQSFIVKLPLIDIEFAD